MNDRELLEALRALIRGDGVGRASHALVFDGRDLTGAFRSLLVFEGFIETRVDAVEIRPGERVPAFCIEGATCHFGWVFWEVFEPGRQRKIFGSAAKNSNGDWTVLRGRSALVHANAARRERMDVDRPSSF